MYDELIKNLRKMQSHEYCVLVSIDGFPALQIVKQAADAIEELFASCKNFEAALKDSVEECEKLQLYVDLYKDLTEKSQKAATEFKQQLQKSEEDNVNLTGWIAEEHAKHLWIPVTERLPDENDVVLITDSLDVGTGYLIKGKDMTDIVKKVTK